MGLMGDGGRIPANLGRTPLPVIFTRGREIRVGGQRVMDVEVESGP
jgi:hypothetical protein